MKIDVADLPQVGNKAVLITVTGNIDSAELLKAFDELCIEGKRFFTIDLTKVERIDGIGIGTIVGMAVTVRPKDGYIMLIFESKQHPNLYTLVCTVLNELPIGTADVLP